MEEEGVEGQRVRSRGDLLFIRTRDGQQSCVDDPRMRPLLFLLPCAAQRPKTEPCQLSRAISTNND